MVSTAAVCCKGTRVFLRRFAGLTGFGLTRHFFIAMTARRIRLWGGAAVVVPVEARSSSSLASFGSI